MWLHLHVHKNQQTPNGTNNQKVKDSIKNDMLGLKLNQTYGGAGKLVHMIEGVKNPAGYTIYAWGF